MNTNFSSSTASVVDIENGSYLVTFHLLNTGQLTSKDTMLSLVLPTGWEYKETSGTIEQILVQDRAYGQLMEFRMAPIGRNQSRDVAIHVKKLSDDSDGTLFAALTSQYSSPIYSSLKPELPVKPQPFWSSWIRSSLSYIGLLFGEIWSRFMLAVRYTA